MTEPAPVPRRSLPTLNQDGTRFLIRPKLSQGRFLRRRRIVGYALIALFVILPHLRIAGRPPVLIDLVHRELVFFGTAFRPSEGFLLMLLGLAVVLTVFFVTAMWGRIWCGYGCPQSVYLELVFRPIERWLEGNPAQQRALDSNGGGWKRKLKWAIYAVLAFVIANVFLSYFVPTNILFQWITSSPAVHPGGFSVVAAVTALMFFDFAYFREQTCTVACPYGRLQSVLLDRSSLIVGYDAQRGEPRGKVGKKVVAARQDRGDCIDCGACVTTCPTGIDIREGLQMECIGCAQCIDACDPIMDKLKRPRGLIRYASQDQLAGKAGQLSRIRVWIYPALLTLVLGIFVSQLAGRRDSELWVLRNDAAAFQTLEDGRVSSLVQVKIENRSSATRDYTVALADDLDAQMILSRPLLSVRGGHAEIQTLFVISQQSDFHDGKRQGHLVVREAGRDIGRLAVTLLGPEGRHDQHHGDDKEPSQ
jgi:cytochrome c oxidase accessory protein FixG